MGGGHHHQEGPFEMWIHRHSLHERMAELARGGLSDPAIGGMLNVHRKTVARVRKIEGIDPFDSSKGLAQTLESCMSTDANGHTSWSGVLTSNGAAQVFIDGRYVRVARLLFEQFHGRRAMGKVAADCGVKHCLTVSHLLDDLTRRTLYLQVRALRGLYGHWDTCPSCGADWDTAGRVLPDLRIYCLPCSNRRVRNHRERKCS